MSKTKKDLVRTIAEQIKIPQLRTRTLVQSTFDALIDVLAKEGRLELRNFGVFQIKQRKARTARNPRTGEQIAVGAKNVVAFKPGKEMEIRVQEFQKTQTAVQHQPEANAEDGPESTSAE